MNREKFVLVDATGPPCDTILYMQWFSLRMKTRIGSTGENMVFRSTRQYACSKTRGPSHSWSGSSRARSAGIQSAWPEALLYCWSCIRSRRKMAKKKSASSLREKRLPASALFTTPMRGRAELERLAVMADSAIDFSDAPAMKALPPQVHVGRFYRPLKEQISLRVDADVLAWFRSQGKKYQTYMNAVLRREMQARPKGR